MNKHTKGAIMKTTTGLLLITSIIMMSACTTTEKSSFTGKVDNTPYATKECNQGLSRGTEIITSDQIDKIVVYKKKRKLYTYKNGKEINEYRMSLGAKGGANGGNKVKAGDYRTPEGSYTIVRKKCDNRLYKSLMISYPNNTDRARAAKTGVSPGGYITIHGQPKWNADGKGDNYTLSNDWTEGCMAVSNSTMDTLWKAVKNGVKIDIHP